MRVEMWDEILDKVNFPEMSWEHKHDSWLRAIRRSFEFHFVLERSVENWIKFPFIEHSLLRHFSWVSIPTTSILHQTYLCSIMKVMGIWKRIQSSNCFPFTKLFFEWISKAFAYISELPVIKFLSLHINSIWAWSKINLIENSLKVP